MCFVFYNDEVLMMKANATKEWDGTYDPVGGHIEKGESIIDNALKEIKEETALDVQNTKLRGVVHVSDFFGKDIMLFVTSSEAITKDVTANYEGDLEWVKIDKIDNLKIFEDVKPILKHVLTMKSDEMFFGISKFDGKDKLLSLDISLS